MRLARYVGGGVVEIVSERKPTCPPGGLLVRTEACGLCSGELMAWYMDRKIPHVLGHEVAGIVVESEDERFPVGCRVAPHHHAPDPGGPWRKRNASVHDPVWRSTKLIPGGMAEFFAVPQLNLADTWRVDDVRPRDAALVEPLGCVVKALRRLNLRGDESVAVIGLGFMGVMFSLLLPGCVAVDLNPARREWAASLGIDARPVDDIAESEVVVVCPGSSAAVDLALRTAAPDARICLFAPLAPGETYPLDLHGQYFRDLTLITSYSCGPEDTGPAVEILRQGRIQAEHVVSDFVALNDLPAAYDEMRAGRILKAMVEF